MDKMKRHLVWWGAGILVAVAAIAWWMLRPAGIPEGFAASNGRIEATEVDIATKIAGRIDTILVSEGQFVRQGEVLAKMDTRVLQEQRLEAIAQIKEAESAVAAARALLEQRQSEMRAAQSVVKQREAELDSVSKRHVRSRSLSQQLWRNTRFDAEHQLQPFIVGFHGFGRELRHAGDKTDRRRNTQIRRGVQHQSRFAADLQQPSLFGRQEKCHINVAEIDHVQHPAASR